MNYKFDPAIMSGLLARVLMVLIGGWLTKRGMDEKTATDFIGAACFVIVPILWGYFRGVDLKNSEPPKP